MLNQFSQYLFLIRLLLLFRMWMALLVSVLNISCPTVGTKGRCKKDFQLICYVFCFPLITLSRCLFLFDITTRLSTCVWIIAISTVLLLSLYFISFNFSAFKSALESSRWNQNNNNTINRNGINLSLSEFLFITDDCFLTLF